MKLTKTQKRILQRLRQLGGLMVHHGEHVEYSTLDGKPLHKKTISHLIAKEALVPAGDGLLADCPQTYRVADAI